MLYCKYCNKLYFKYDIEKDVVGKIKITRIEYGDENVSDSVPELLRYSTDVDYYGESFQYFCSVCGDSKVTKYKAKYSDVYDTVETLKEERDYFVLTVIPYIESFRKDDCIDLSNLSVEDGFRLKHIIDTYYE